MNDGTLAEDLQKGDRRALARCLSLVENDPRGSWHLLEQLEVRNRAPVTGITGPPGAGKSTLVSALCQHLIAHDTNTRIAVLAVDPSSPFSRGALLGDRVRMAEHFNNPSVFIRSAASRGALGGLSARSLEMVEVMQAAGFDHIFIETVGVGQSEVDIAALADTTAVVFVPESGDDIQAMKSGIMEIADVFVVNKADREGADRLLKNLQSVLEGRTDVPVFKTIANARQGVGELMDWFASDQKHLRSAKKQLLLAEKAVRLARNFLLRDVDFRAFSTALGQAQNQTGFNLFRFISDWFGKKSQ